MAENVRVLSDLHLLGALVWPDDSQEFPANPSLGTFVIKDRGLYGYLRVGGMETWYPFASKTAYYVHSQGVPALNWYVEHNLGTTNLWIQVKDENGNIISVGKQDLSDNQFKLTFTTAVKGTVMVVAPDSVDVPTLKASLIEVGSTVKIDTFGVKINGAYALTEASFAAQIAEAVAPKADTAYVDQRFSEVVGMAPSTLDSLAEIADRLIAEEGVGDALGAAVALKADKAEVDAALALKADDDALSVVAKTGKYSDLLNVPSLGSAAAKNAPAIGNAAADEVVLGSDARLSDARTPTAHAHSIDDVNGLRATIETLTTALSSAILRIQTLETNMANAVVYSDGKLHY